MAELAALGIQPPNINAMGSFAQGASNAIALSEAKRQQAERAMQTIGAVALGAMGGKLDGPVDPQKFEQGLDILQGMGMKVDQFRGKPQMAPLAARASMTALQQLQTAQNEREFDFLMQKFGRSVMESDREYGLARETLDYNKSKAEAGTTPSGYRQTADGALEAIPGGPADPSNPINTKKVTGPALSATAQKELFEADESVQAGAAVVSALDKALELNKQAYSGPGAGARGYAGSLVGMDDAVATEELNNLITSQALDQLKQTFGSMPTEGERKILLEIQGSVNQAPEVRKRIYERAKEMATKRTEFNRQKASRLRSGEYFSEGPGSEAPSLDEPTAEETGAAATGGATPVYARNPQTGERLMLQNGQWVPAR